MPQDDRGYAVFLQGILTMHQYLLHHLLDAIVENKPGNLTDMLPILAMAVDQMDDITEKQPTPQEVAETLGLMKSQIAELVKKSAH